MLTISDFMKLPSLNGSYLVAGFGGLFNNIKKMEVMEEPYPSVLEFLVPNELFLTTFWSMKEAKSREDRVNLVRAMIEARCTGIGIMPDPHLGGEIDREIIELADKNDFPIIYISKSVRWGDVINEYCILISSELMPVGSSFDDMFDVFLDFHQSSDVSAFCRQLYKTLKIPLILIADTVYNYGVQNIAVASVVARIQSISEQNRQNMASPISLSMENDITAVVHFGKRSIVVGCLQSNAINSHALTSFNGMAPKIAKELDAVCSYPYPAQVSEAVKALEDSEVYYVLCKLPWSKKAEPKIASPFVFYEMNRYFNYYIILLPQRDSVADDIYVTYSQLYSKVSPELFVFSQQSVHFRDFAKKIEELKYFVNKLSYLDGVFSEDEFPLLYTLAYSPREFKNRVLRLHGRAVYYPNHEGVRIVDDQPRRHDEVRGEEKSFYDTLRLYIVVKNISSVAKLLGIHANSVKYRIGKALKMLGYKNENVLGDSPYINLLMQLELISL